ncbi:AAA family ATPase [Mycobacterium sp. M1]|uniref:AAA family ATPase n=2 Tax=Mycolicibacter acidiphilus TaxID=2835306 RepID=A0ABS5RL67_9MYCO|nr:helix-turn-helix transcriptional regulator [Mycolicibacter acidiphilus]MBS9535030.1 AAA family ATPase [Mycolicibacter acidiphilus]
MLGQSGVGKSTLARALAAAAETRGCAVRFALGTQTGRDVPLGAFSRVVGVDAGHAPAAMLAAAHQNLERERDLVVVIDDAQLLDPLSATLVYQIAAERTARLIVVVQSGEPVPDSITALLKERWLESVPVGPFTPEQTAQLARAVLAGAVEPSLVDQLQRRTGGNPLLLRGLLSPGRENGVLVQTESGWRLQGALHPDRELHDLLEVRVRSLSDEERDVIEIVAVAELLDWRILRGLCAVDAVERLERLGMIHLVADGSETVVGLNHPVIGEVAIELAGVVRTRRINGDLAEAHRRDDRRGDRGGGAPDVRTRIRTARFLMHSDLPLDLDLIIDAAEGAMTAAHIAAGEDLARFALDHGGGLRAAMILADALRWAGRSDAAEAVLSEFDPDGSDPLLTVRWACLRASILFESCGRVDEARRILADVRGRIDAPSALSLVTATEVSFDFFAGDAGTAAEAGLALCAADPHPLATVWAAAPAAWAAAFAGSFEDVARVARTGLDAAARGGSGPQLLIIGLAEAMARASAGDLADAEDVVERYAAVSAGIPEAEGIVAAVRGYVLLLRGTLGAACAALQESMAKLSVGFQPAGLVLAASWCAQAEAGRGDTAAGAAAVRCAERVHGPQTAAFAPELEIARARVAAAEGRTTAALQHAERAAQLARRAGMYAVESRAVHTAVRYGDRSQAARAGELARMLWTPLSDVMALHARGVASRDGGRLDGAADRFAEIGVMAMAADAAAQAAAEYARSGDRERELESAGRARRWAQQTGLASPATVATARPLPITAREREIAALAAAGLSNREIADRISVSVRTVDGHLYRIFGKLDVRSRDQLARLLSGHPDAQVFGISVRN